MDLHCRMSHGMFVEKQKVPSCSDKQYGKIISATGHPRTQHRRILILLDNSKILRSGRDTKIYKSDVWLRRVTISV